MFYLHSRSVSLIQLSLVLLVLNLQYTNFVTTKYSLHPFFQFLAKYYIPSPTTPFTVQPNRHFLSFLEQVLVIKFGADEPLNRIRWQ